jgi:microcystin-dependent protein
MTLYRWSQTAASNATADASINWQEGQAPSSVNDSARAMMASAAKYRDDITGAIVTGGTSTAYTVASYQAFDSLAHLSGQIIAFTPHTTSGATVTLNVDGLGAKALRTSPNVELLAGMLIQGTPYMAVYNNADAAFYLHGFFGANPYNVPLAAGMDYWGATTPNSAFAFPAGQAISRTTYASLFVIIGATYGAGDGSTTFNLPDLRGRVVAALDNMGGSAASRLTTAYFGANSGQPPTTLGNVGGLESHTLTTAQLASHSHANTLSDPGHAHATSPGTGSNVVINTGLNTNVGFSSGSSSTASLTVSSNTTGISITNASVGGANAHPNVQPTIVSNYIMRVI